MQKIKKIIPRIRGKVFRVGALYMKYFGAARFKLRGIFVDTTEFDVLRNQYVFYYNPIVRRLKNKLQNLIRQPVYKINIIEGARISVCWGGIDTQVLGKKSIGSHSEYLHDAATRVSEGNKNEEAAASAIKVLTFCTFAHGGAGTGSIRRIGALRDAGVDARLISLLSKREDEYVGRVIPALDALGVDNQDRIWMYINSNIKSEINKGVGYCGQEFFSTDVSVLKFGQLMPLIDTVDIVHLHWVVGMLDYETMNEKLRNKLIVWTTADMNAFTGGCHYSEGCEGFMNDCSPCPMVDRSNNAPHLVWKNKRDAYRGLNITLVCPSEHIAKLARKSSLLGDRAIHVIPNAYPVDLINPQERAVSLEKYGLSKNKKYVLFAAESLSNLRKGADLLYTVARKLKKHDVNDDIEFVTIGKSEVNLPFKVHNLGSVKQEHLSYVYSAADVFVSLSREDVGPMTVVESLLCGTPVVGFNIGVIPDVVQQDVTGRIVEPFSINGVVEGVLYFLKRDDGEDMVERCSRSARRYADPELSAMRHKALYSDLIDSNIIGGAG